MVFSGFQEIMDTKIRGQQAMKNPMFFFIHFISSMTHMFNHPYSYPTIEKSKFQAIP